MRNPNCLWLLLMLSSVLAPCQAALARKHALREYAYLFADDGIRQYRVGSDGRLQALKTVLSPGREYRPVAVDAPRRAVYASDTDIWSTQPDPSNRIRQYHISRTGVLMPMRPPVVLTHPYLTDMAVVPGRPLVFTVTDDYLEAYRVCASGALRLIHAYPKLAGYSLDSVAALTPDDLLVFTTNSTAPDRPIRHVVLHYRIAAGGTLRALPVRVLLSILAAPDFSLSPSGRTLCTLGGVPGRPGSYSPAVVVYPLRAGPRFLAEAPVVTSLQATHSDAFASLACTDRFVFCGLADVGGPVQTTPSPVDVRSYRIGADRRLTLLSRSAVRPADRPIPYVDVRGRFLYVVGGAGVGRGTVDAYRIAGNGRLTLVQSLHGFGTISALKFALLTRPRQH